MKPEDLILKPDRSDIGTVTAEVSSHAPGHGSADVSEAAERFARQHGIWSSLIILKAKIASNLEPIDAVKVDLISDPEVEDWCTLCFTIRTRAALEAALELDERLRDLIGESIAVKHLVYFAVRFEFAE